MNARKIRNVLLALAVAALLHGQDDDSPRRLLEKKVHAIAQKMDKAFVFFPGGSGSLISEDGYCLTNHHVAGSRESVTVHLCSGKRYTARRVATDPWGDVALFKIEAPEKFEYVELGDSDALEVGEYVVAVGNPLGLGNAASGGRHYPTISVGIVSANHRRQGGYSDCIQTDASVNPGNSGGPLMNLKGEQVGINGRIATRYGNRVNSGVGYAIPSNQIKRFLPVMKAGGDKGLVYHGEVKGLTLSNDHTDGAGAKVQSVAPGSTAEKAGFQAGDLIVRVDSRKSFSRDRFLGIIGTYPAGSEVDVTVIRGNREVTLKVKLDKYVPEQASARAPQRPPNAGYLGVQTEDGEGGVRIVDVIPDTPADHAGLQVDDVILKIAGKDTPNTRAFQTELWKFKPGDKVRITIRRRGEELELEAELSKPPGP